MFTNLIVIINWPKSHSIHLALALCLTMILLGGRTFAQDYYLPFNEISNIRLERAGVFTQPGVHGGIKPVFAQGVDVSAVAGLGPDSTKYYYKFGAKIFSEHLIEIDKPGFKFYADPIFNFGYGEELKTFDDDGSDLSINTRGFSIGGKIGEKVYFYADLRENQSRLPAYLDVFTDSTEVIPGSGRFKPFKDTGYDYSMANGYVGITAAKWLNIQFGTKKDFIGHGYRSVILSDNAFNYPFAGYTLNFFKGKLKYNYQIALLQKLDRLPLGDAPESIFKRKYQSSSYLSWKITPRLEVGLYESVMWKYFDDSTGTEPFNANAIDPIPLLNSAILGLNDPDNNALLGLNIGWQPYDMLKFYGQYVVDDFKTDKYGYQLGAKLIGLFDRIDVLAEYNVVEKGTFGTQNPLQGHTHFNQPMAHPYGAGFKEVIGALTYSYKRWYGQFKWIESSFSNTGRDPLISSDEIEYSPTQSLSRQDLQLAYIFNPRTNMQLYVGITNREEFRDDSNRFNQFWYFGFRTRMSNIYNDF